MEDGEPCPLFTGFAMEGSDRSYAGEVEQHEEHEGEGCQRREAGCADISAVEDGERGDDGFFRGKTGDEADGHLPVKAKWFQERRNELADSRQVRVFEIIQVLRREILERPDDDGSPENDRANLLQVIRYAFPYMCGSIT